MTKQTIYTVGGTVQAGGGIYIPRKADDELLTYCRAGEFAFILSSRQVGKSSLMFRTAQQLKQDGICSVIIDLSDIGVKISPDEWYLGILYKITEELNLKIDIISWWTERAGLGPPQRMTNFFRDVLLKEVSGSVVLFFDEIDSTLSIPFADDFFAALRAIYNARPTITDFKRLSFVMIGVATPSDLIKDSMRTPFNIGRRVELTDFTFKELQPLASGLGENGEQVLGWVFDWTSGHPYLTQSLCAFLSKNKEGLTREAVEGAVKDLFLGERGMEDNNLQFVRDMLLKRATDTIGVLQIYQQIIAKGKLVGDDEQSPNKSHLKLSGVVRRRKNTLSVSNLIYQKVFDLKWVKEHLPLIGRRTLELTIGVLIFTMVLFAIGFVSLGKLTPSGYVLPIVICTPKSPLVNVYRAAPQPWVNDIYNRAFPLVPTSVPPNPPLQFDEQSILDARYTAFQQLIKETTRWSDTKMITMNDLSEVRVTLTYLSPELLQAVFLNQVLKDRSITYGFQDELQKVLGPIADRNELLFLLTVTTKNNSVKPTRHIIKIPVQSMVMHNAENLTITHSHDDQNLEQNIDTFSDPVFGYLAYPFAQVSGINGCKWILDPKFNTNIVVTVPYIYVDGVTNDTPVSWTIPYAPLLNLSTPSNTPIFSMPPGYDQNQMTPTAFPPKDINQPNYWQDQARFIWNQITLGSY